MRTEHRHQKKTAAFAGDPISGQENETSAWTDALPALDDALDGLPETDRTLLIDRYFEKKRFAEIARRAGKSEAACKMQMKRALEKLAGLLRSRGVALTVPVVAAGLSAELAKAAPLASAGLASKALAASGGVSATTLFSNTILTMSAAKTSAIAAAVVVAIFMIPIARQESKAAHLRDEIHRLETSQSAAARPSKRPRPVAAPLPTATTMRELLDQNASPIEAGPLLDDMTRVLNEQDIAGLIRVLTPVAHMDAAEFSRLMKDMEAMKGNSEAKAMAMQVLASFAPETDHRETVENLIRQGVNPGGWSDAVRRWARADPDAALAWFEEMRADGKLLGKGVHSDPTLFVLADIAAGMAGNRPEQALDIAAGLTAQERRQSRIADKLVPILAATYLESGDPALLDRLVGSEEVDHRKTMLVDDIAKALAGSGDFDAARFFIAHTVSDSGRVDERMVTVLANLRDLPFKERAEWIIGNTADAARRIGGLVESSVVLGEDAVAWIREQPPGEMKNQALSFPRAAARRNEKPSS
ncbi:MAG: sigma-70 family RNA polymerase sigma factor, partial [Verrucomicrobiae bacterium]|nr:sigma-70 family RNA polymerase sigma factor [Verrucomicrobiae bacterium]